MSYEALVIGGCIALVIAWFADALILRAGGRR